MDVVPDVPDVEASAVPEASTPSNIVQIPCSCPHTPHEYDTVTLASVVPLDLGMAASYIMASATDEAVTLGRLAVLYLRLGVKGWSLVDDTGNPELVTPDNIARRLPYSQGGYEVAERANELYNETVMRPLLSAREKSLPPSPTDDSTPLMNGTGPKHPKPSSPSSPTGTAGNQSEAPAS